MEIAENRINSKKGFTLIELIVVIAVIGILVLLAAPKFLGQAEKANLAQIQSDVRAVEDITNMERVKAESENEVYFDNLSKLEDNEVDELTSNGNVYNKSGEVSQIEGGPFYSIPNDVVKEAGSSLPGSFIANKEGKVYYINDEGSNDGEIEEPEGEHVAKDEDFEWVRNSSGYSVEGESGAGYYNYIGSEKTVEIPHEIKGHKMTSYYRMFDESDENIEKIISANKNVADMNRMFAESQAESLDLSSFDTSDVTDMSYMFYKSQAESLDLSSLDTSSVTDMNKMFYESEATTLDLSSFDTSKVSNMEDMFYNSQATSLDLSNFDTSNVTDMSLMFSGSQATTIDLSNWDTSNVTDMSNIFWKSEATELDLSNWDTSNVTDMSNMFAGSKANSLDLSNFNTKSVTDMSNMFLLSSAEYVDLSGFKTQNVEDMSGMFAALPAQDLDVSGLNTEKVANMSAMFADVAAKELDLSEFNTSEVKNMESMFENTIVKELDLRSFNTSNIDIDEMNDMFRGSSAEKGYAKNKTEVSKFNSTSRIPKELKFEMKE